MALDARSVCADQLANGETPRGRPLKLPAFYGWRVVGAAFVLAMFGWGMGFYGPPIFLRVIGQTRGWPLAVVSTAVTVHFLIGAVVGANLPACYRRLGPPLATKVAALCLAAGVVGWATCTVPWQLFVASVLSGVAGAP
jgi:hypothetical protein